MPRTGDWRTCHRILRPYHPQRREDLHAILVSKPCECCERVDPVILPSVVRWTDVANLRPIQTIVAPQRVENERPNVRISVGLEFVDEPLVVRGVKRRCAICAA